MEKTNLKRRIALLAAALTLGISGVGGTGTIAVQAAEQDGKLSEQTDLQDSEPAEVQLFVAASLNQVMVDLTERYEKEHPGVKFLINADSSGTLLTQIQEGYACDIFFSAAQKQMDMLEEEGLILEGTRANAVSNEVVLITLKDSGTKVTGLENLQDAESIALAGGSVPVGRYTRKALMELGVLERPETSEFDPAQITTEEISEALGGVEISEQSNVSKVLLAVVEGSCEVGTAYYSDIYGYEDQLDILETVSSELTGDVSYPVCRVQNEEADEEQAAAADGFYEYILSDEAKEIFEKYYFIS